MQNFRKIIPAAALIIGLAAGLGIGHIQVGKEQNVCEGKIKEADRKVVFMQKQVEDARTEAAATTSSVQEQCKNDRDRLENLQNENKTVGAQLGNLRVQMKTMEIKVTESDQTSSRIKKESDELAARSKKELHELERNNKNMEAELKKAATEKQALQARLDIDLKKTTHELGRCKSNNAELCIIAEDLIKKYRNKGLGSVLVGNEPLTEIRKIELEQFIQKYHEEINSLRTEKK